ncbi:sulfurtransferase TusA family protein [Sinomonas sp. ASV322]|uniref:sulfurtransferase TusA family protein n=1 Tax=Sinomonas sp. ASV322 TaxID=3041920 RepID=UPI0027DD32DD|nr:sulfurtransferase TusA family protein [Sinomonas sp. ASV322]MDQ4503513.1 sulfurtransferase TusA family protein [Sinomonas sp. ASV322]
MSGLGVSGLGVSRAAVGVHPAAVCDGGPLDCGGGLLIAIRRALGQLAPGQILEIRSEARSVAVDLPAWCEVAGHPLEGTANHGISTSYFVRKAG